MSGKEKLRARLWRGASATLAALLTVGSLPLGLAGAHEEGEGQYTGPLSLASESSGSADYSLQSTQGRTPFAPKQLIYVVDGMRPDMVNKYAQAGDMPNYNRMMTEGVSGVNGMVPQIASNTGAGWTTIATGAWPGVHGQMNNTYGIASNPITNTSTSGLAGNLTQAETYQEVAEKAGKKVAVIEWPGALPSRIKGPVIDYRNFYSSRGVVSTSPISGYRPDPGLVYTDTLQISDAAGWSGAPQSFSPAKETSFFFRTNPITNTVVTLTWPVYIYDSTNDNAVNYDRAVISRQGKSADQRVAELKVGDWAPVKVNLPQNGLLVGNYIKLLELNPNGSSFKLYFTSLTRARSNLPDLEEKIAQEFPPVTAADFLPIQAGLIDPETYVQQGLKFYEANKPIQDYIVQTYTPDLVMAGYPAVDEFSHQFLALTSPNFSGTRPFGLTAEAAENYIKMAYKQADESLGNLLRLLGPSTNTFLGADHGFAATWKAVNVGKVLLDAGLQGTEQSGNCRPSTTPADAVSTTLALGCYAGGTANIYVNLAGRNTNGVVPAAEYENVRKRIVDAFNNLTDGGNKVVGRIFLKEETRKIAADGQTINYWHPTRTGDVVVLLQPPYQFDAATRGQAIVDAPFFGQHGFMPDLVNLEANINLHAMFGIHGPNIARGKKLNNPASVDLVVTAAYAFGIPAPRNATGRVLLDAFADNSANLLRVQVLGWSDYHGQLDPVDARVDNFVVRSGGVAAIGAYWNELKAQNPQGTIILSDGDNIGATPPNSAFLNDVPIIEAMNLIGFTASAAGNHEFDKGTAGYVEKLGQAKFAYLANNIVDERTGQLAPFARPYIIVKANGIDVGIIGAANPETPLVTSPRGIAGYRWVDPLEPTNRYVKELVGRGVRTILVTYHQGSASGDFDVVNGVWSGFIRGLDPEVDMVFGGHTRIKTMTRVNGILVTAANHALETSRHTLLIDPQTKNVVWSWGAFDRPFAPGITPDPALADLVKQANDRVRPILGEQVGVAAALVDRSRGAESKMGNFVSDAIRATYQVDVALQNSGGLRADFNPGPITKGDVFAVLPFGNLVVTGKIKGSDLLAALENGVSDVSGSAGRFIQLSGLRFAYDASKPVGQRVLWAVLSDGRPLDPNGTYTIATNDFMQVGGDGYTALTRMTEVTSREQLYEVAANYVASVKTVDPQVEGRIIAAQAGQPAPTPPTAATPGLPTPISVLPTAVPSTPTVAAQPTGQANPTQVPLPSGMPRTGASDNGATWLLPIMAAIIALLALGTLIRRQKLS
jgi:2',3'-cyclic-nucleotide 2'-phosphodiesterase (5'-nucleotidase family)/predicted AlkP superfamily phosphohydrolase/phosphomutase